MPKAKAPPSTPSPLLIRLIKLREVQQIVPLPASVIYDEILKLNFPPQVKITSKTGKNAAAAWVESEVIDYALRMVAASRALHPYSPPALPLSESPGHLQVGGAK